MNQLVDEAIFESEVLTDVKSEQIRIIFASTVVPTENSIAFILLTILEN